MPQHFNAALIDPSVSPDEVELALNGTATEFPSIDAQDSVDDDAQMARGLVAIRPATPHQAILNARNLRDSRKFVGIGMCLYDVRGPIFGLPALWPDANAAAVHGAPIHRVKDFSEIPRAAVVGFKNARHGHITLSLGGGLNNTTDYHELGYNGVATIANTAEWCGATDVFWYEVLNGIDVWPAPQKPKHEPKPWSLQDRRDFIHRRLVAAREGGHEHVAHELKVWQDHMDAKLEGHK